MYLDIIMSESFGEIIDPETNRTVPVTSNIGQQVIKNYLECLKNGPESTNIVSTKMFYAKEKVQNNPIKKQPTISTDTGSLRGVCAGLCGRNVYSTHERVKYDGKYYHEKCYKLLESQKNK